MSDSEEMYLVHIARLSQEGQAGRVPLSQLAEKLEIASVSANQMVRHLEEAGLVTYTPYQGVDLTLKGQARAAQVLRSRRLWEVFLVEQLRYLPAEAEEQACLLEHDTSIELADRLWRFLDSPTTSPTGDPIPVLQPEPALYTDMSLTCLPVGSRARLARFEADSAARQFLLSAGLLAGSQVYLIAANSDGTLLVETQDGQRITLAADLARQIWIKNIPEKVNPK